MAIINCRHLTLVLGHVHITYRLTGTATLGYSESDMRISREYPCFRLIVEDLIYLYQDSFSLGYGNLPA